MRDIVRLDFCPTVCGHQGMLCTLCNIFTVTLNMAVSTGEAARGAAGRFSY